MGTTRKLAGDAELVRFVQQKQKGTGEKKIFLGTTRKLAGVAELVRFVQQKQKGTGKEIFGIHEKEG